MWSESALDDFEISELRVAQFRQRQYQSIMSRHPDCRDPMHPGCPRCETEDGETLEYLGDDE